MDYSCTNFRLRLIFAFLGCLLLLLFPKTDILAQDVLQKMTVTPIPSSERPPAVIRDHPDKAAVIFESEITNLTFSSNMLGVVDVTGNSDEGQYIVIIEPFTQIIHLNAKGYIRQSVRIGNPSPRDIFYFSVESMDETSNLISVVFNISPEDARLFVDDQETAINETAKIQSGEKDIRIEREGYRTINDRIVVSSDRIQFNYELEEIDIVPVNFEVNVSGANVILDGTERGVIDESGNLGIFLYPGEYALTIQKSGYVSITQTLEITESGNNRFSFTTQRNIDTLDLNISPQTAELLIYDERYEHSTPVELTPGTYPLEIRGNGYLTEADTVEIELGKTVKKTISLKKNVGTLNLSLSPENATVLINKQPVSNSGTVELAPGRYRMDVEKEGYDSYSENFDVNLGETIQKEITLEPQYGSLQFKVIPGDASVELFNSDGELIKRWNGINFLKKIQVGNYQLIVKADNYQIVDTNTSILKNETTKTEIELDNALSLFYLAENGKTVLCPNADIGDSGEINGITFTKRASHQITLKNAPYTCTSGIEDMSNLLNRMLFAGIDINSWDFRNVTEW